jgi:hypothetical protein
MHGHTSILLVFALVFFVIATLIRLEGPAPVAGSPWYAGRIGFHFGWAGLACWVASLIFS